MIPLCQVALASRLADQPVSRPNQFEAKCLGSRGLRVYGGKPQL